MRAPKLAGPRLTWLKLGWVLSAIGILSGMTVLRVVATANEKPGAQVEAKIPAVPSGPLTVVYFRADPPRIRVGQSSILKWKVTGASSVTLYGQDTSVCEHPFGNVAPEDTMMVCPQETTIYVLAAQGPDGETMQSVTVHVDGVAPKIPTGALFKKSTAPGAGLVEIARR